MELPSSASLKIIKDDSASSAQEEVAYNVAWKRICNHFQSEGLVPLVLQVGALADKQKLKLKKDLKAAGYQVQPYLRWEILPYPVEEEEDPEALLDVISKLSAIIDQKDVELREAAKERQDLIAQNEQANDAFAMMVGKNIELEAEIAQLKALIPEPESEEAEELPELIPEVEEEPVPEEEKEKEVVEEEEGEGSKPELEEGPSEPAVEEQV